MADLRKRFGRLVAAHRRRAGLTQEELAEAADISVDMVSKLESGTSGARFGVIQRLAEALHLDPAELFTTEIAAGAIRRGAFGQIATRLAQLTDADLEWVSNILDAALAPRRADQPTILTAPQTRKGAKPSRRANRRKSGQ